MANLKFRAWNKKLEKMFYSDKNYFTFQEGELIERDGKNSDFMLCRDDIVMQYTGLKDKNGKEIYEGDIVEHKNGSKDFVVYHQECASFALKNNFSLNFIGEDLVEDLKVIGNKYEDGNLI